MLPHRPGMTARAIPLPPSLPKILLHLRAQAIAQFLARHAEGDVGTQKSGLRAAVMPLALKLQPVEFLGLGKPDHRIRKLDLAASAALLRFQDLENLRLQDVAPGDRKVRRRRALWRLFDHSIHLEHLAVALADPANAVLVSAILGYRFHCDQIGLLAKFGRRLDHLCEASRRMKHEFVRQHHGERLIADDIARTPDRVTKPQRRLLACKADGAGFRLVAGQNFHLCFLAARLKRGVKFVHAIEMILDHALVAAGDKDEMLDAGFPGLVEHILDQRLVDDGEHLLGHRLGGGQHAGAETGDGKDGFADFHGVDNCLADKEKPIWKSPVGSRFAAKNKGPMRLRFLRPSALWSFPKSLTQNRARLLSCWKPNGPPKRTGLAGKITRQAGLSMRQSMAVIGCAIIFATATPWQAQAQSTGNNPLELLGNIFGGKPKP